MNFRCKKCYRLFYCAFTEKFLNRFDKGMTQAPHISEQEEVIGQQRKGNSEHLRWTFTFEDVQLIVLDFYYCCSFHFEF